MFKRDDDQTNLTDEVKSRLRIYPGRFFSLCRISLKRVWFCAILSFRIESRELSTCCDVERFFGKDLLIGKEDIYDLA